MQDVKELEDRGIPSLLDQNDAKNYKYGLSSWATFSNKNLVIAPTETKKVTVFINKTRLSQGGHYASVLAEIKQLSEGKTVKLRAILSSLLFVRTGSDSEKEEGNITSILHESNYLAYPSAITFRLQNTGNVDLIPYGLVTVSDPYGRQVSRSAVNENSLITLPDSIRKYVVVIKNDRFLPPGFYTAKVELTVGKKKIKIVKEERFFSLGSMSMKSISVILIVLIGGGIIALKIPRRREVN